MRRIDLSGIKKFLVGMKYLWMLSASPEPEEDCFEPKLNFSFLII